MAYDNNLTITGNLTRDPEMRFTQGGMAICEFGLAWNRKRDEEEVVSFFDVTAFRSLAENCGETLSKGMRVTVVGHIEQDRWEDKDTGQARSKVKIIADQVSPSLQWATATVEKNPYDDQGGGNRGGGGSRSRGRSSGGNGGGRQQRARQAHDDYDDEPF